MSCYRPNTLVYMTNPNTGEVHTKFLPINPYAPESAEKLALFEHYVPIPCGKCIGCTLDRSRSWADRMILELDHSKTAVFLTLTYNDDHLSFADIGDCVVPILVKDDVQRFFKRLRYYYRDKEIRYYLVGEYGSQTYRPHYHAILYGFSLDDFSDKQLVGVNEFHQAYFSSPKLEDIWGKGFITLSAVSWQTCAYVARYVQKKSYSDAFGMSPYVDFANVPNEFSLMSRRPGIGGYFAAENPDFDFASKLVFSDKNGTDPGSRSITFPRYVIDKLSDFKPDLAADIISQRREFASVSLDNELQNTDLCGSMYLANKERVHLERAKKLLRR